MRVYFTLGLWFMSAMFVTCHSAKNHVPSSGKGPFFGNGMRNGWVDQHSISLWTRLTSIPDLNHSGIQFTELSKEEHAILRNQGDVERITKAQIPEGHTLDEMDGACPGSSGFVKLVYYERDNPTQKIEGQWLRVNENKNHTRQWRLEGLNPGTRYVAEIYGRALNSEITSDSVVGFFETAPNDSTTKAIRFSVVTGHDFNRRDDPENGHKIYRSMMLDNLDFYIHTGDIEYYDKPNPWAMTEALMYFKWNRLFALPLQRNFYLRHSTYFIKDDHDALSNDCYPGMVYGAVTFERGLEIFDEEQFPSNDSLYKTIRWGKDLQIWLVEGRNFRSKNSDPDGPEKTIWGETQKTWLFNTLTKSDATFKIIITSTPILGPDRGKKNDNYANSGFTYEGDEIRNFIDQFDNVFICTGDRHWQYVSHIDNTNLWEFSCGPGSDQHAGGWEEDNVLPEHRFLRVKGGYLVVSVSPRQTVPTIAFEHRDVDGVIVHEKIFSIAQ